MDQPTIDALKTISGAKAAMLLSVQFAANEYANGGGRAKPIVDAHFTAGNQARYGWAPLSRDYFLAKARGIIRQSGRGAGKIGFSHADLAKLARSKAWGGFLSTHGSGGVEKFKATALGRVGAKLDPFAGFRSSTGTLTGQGTAANVPMLVRSGALKEAANSRHHKVEVDAGTGTVTVWFLFPDYAKFLHEGTGKMPKRSPVELNAADLAAVQAAIARRLSVLTATGGPVAISANTIPGQARML